MVRIVLCILSMALLAAAEKIVTLTVQESAGTARVREPVTAGVPLPRGLVRDAAELAVADGAGQPVPAYIKAVSRWDDGSVRWIHAHFQADVPAGGRGEFSLVRGKGMPVKGLTISETADRFVIQTGALKFTVRKRGFNGIDEAWAGGRQVVASHKLGPLVRFGGRDYRAADDGRSEVIVEERTPFYVVLKATGSAGFRYTCRLTAYAGQANVAAQFTVVNTVGPKREDYVPLERLSWELPVSFPVERVAFGGETRTHEARGRNAWLYQDSSDHYTTGGAVSGSGRGKSAKPLTTGWLSAAGGRAPVAAGVRWFWQTYPKALEVSGGTLKLDLYPDRARPLDIYTGVSRTHDLLFAFQPANFAAFQQPLRAMAPLKWYCRDTRAFGNLVEAEPGIFGEHAGAVRKYVDWWTANFDNIKTFRDGREVRGIFRDAYGWLEFGDGFHHVWQPGNDNPRNLAWDGNYYDFPHAALLHYLLTGRRDFFDFFIEHSRHLADVHLVHYDPDPEYAGSNRYCPPTDHVRMDPRRSGDFTTADVYVSNTFNHHKTQSLFENYLLTGDRRVLDAALLGLRYAYEYTRADAAYNQPRGPGNQLLTLVSGYEFSGDRKYLERCRPIVEAAKRMQAAHGGGFNDVRSSRFQYGIALEGLLRYYEASKDEAVPGMVRQGLDFLIANGHTFTNCAYAAGFLYRRFGDDKYRDFGLRAISRGGVFGNPVKETALTFRSSPYFLYYLAP